MLPLLKERSPEAQLLLTTHTPAYITISDGPRGLPARGPRTEAIVVVACGVGGDSIDGVANRNCTGLKLYVTKKPTSCLLVVSGSTSRGAPGRGRGGTMTTTGAAAVVVYLQERLDVTPAIFFVFFWWLLQSPRYWCWKTCAWWRTKNRIARSGGGGLKLKWAVERTVVRGNLEQVVSWVNFVKSQMKVEI